MGACDYENVVIGKYKNASEAFRYVVNEARYYHGHGGYKEGKFIMSIREDIMNQISEFVSDNYLSSVYSGSGLSKDKRYRYILISKPRVLDGEIRIYGPKFILINYQTAYRSLPHNDRRVFTSAENMINFLQWAFVDGEYDKALEIPTK